MPEGFWRRSGKFGEYGVFQSSKNYSKRMGSYERNGSAEQAAKRTVGVLIIQELVGDYSVKDGKSCMPQGGHTVGLDDKPKMPESNETKLNEENMMYG